MPQPLYIAVDLGAGSGRVFLGGLEPGEFLLEEVRRFHYPATKSDGHLRWNLPLIFDEIKEGLRAAVERARNLERPIRSVGVDSWGVDYGLVDANGNLLELPVAYRDNRTEGVMPEVFGKVSRAKIFERTGIQFLVFNSLFQLHANAKTGFPKSADRLLLIPDLINLFLTGKAVTEYTNATTTQMLNARSGAWDCDLIERLGLPSRLLAEIVPAASDLGPIKGAVADELGLGGAHVIAPATHDTASAVAGAPLEEGWAYISSGTWSLVGVERGDVLINDDVAGQNFTNEGGAFGTVRFLKNVMGLWILESCRREWQAKGLDVEYEKLLRQAQQQEHSAELLFPDDPRFLNPPSMLEAIARQVEENGGRAPTEPAGITRIILDSLALRYASVLRTIETLTNQKIKAIRVVGGGSQNEYLNQTTADVTGLPLQAGPVEATATGNLLVQAIAAGRFASLADARRHVAENIQQKSFSPRSSAEVDKALNRYSAIESRYVK